MQAVAAAQSGDAKFRAQIFLASRAAI